MDLSNDEGDDIIKTREVRRLLDEKIEKQRLKRELDVWDEEFDDWGVDDDK